MSRINKITIKNASQKLSQDSEENGVKITFHVHRRKDRHVDMPLHTIQHAKRMNVCYRITTPEDSNFNQDQKAP
jgi:hypothetical protein